MIIKRGEDGNPYDKEGHSDNCDENVWDLESATLLIGEREIVEKHCSACHAEWKLWEALLKGTKDDETGKPDPMYGDLAFRALNIRRRVVDYHYPITELSAFDFDLVEIASAEISKRNAFLSWKAKQDSESK